MKENQSNQYVSGLFASNTNDPLFQLKFTELLLQAYEQLPNFANDKAGLSRELQHGNVLSPTQISTIISLAEHLRNLEQQIQTATQRNYKVSDVTRRNKNNQARKDYQEIFLNTHNENFEVLKEQLSDQIFILNHLIDNMTLPMEEKEYLQGLVKWQQTILDEIQPLNAEELEQAFKNYANAVEAKEELKGSYYQSVAMTMAAIGITVAFVGFATVLAASSALTLLVLSPLIAMPLMVGSGITAATGAIVALSGGLFINATLTNTIMNIFSSNKVSTLDYAKNKTKVTFENALKPFEGRKNNIVKQSKAPEPASENAGTLARLSSIFVAPIKEKVQSISSAQKSMDELNNSNALADTVSCIDFVPEI